MYKKHNSFSEPENDEVKIWRYMDFTKLVSLLDRQQLFFAKNDKLGDLFEGSYPKENIQKRYFDLNKMLGQIDESQRYWLQQIIHGRDEGVTLLSLDDDYKVLGGVEKVVSDFRASVYEKFFRELRSFVFISCWHKNDGESAAMWKLYLKSNEGIAVQSTVGRLKNCFDRNTPDIYIGEVHYKDYTRDKIPADDLFAAFLHKRRSFEHERELRAIVLDIPPYQDYKAQGISVILEKYKASGIYIPVNLEQLVEQIYVAPEAPSWLMELIKSVVQMYGLNKRVIQSTLDEKPLY